MSGAVTTPTMPTAVYRGEHTVVVEEIPIPEVGPSQVLLEISHCGICGSDLHLMMEDWGPPGMRGGHEFSGVVVAVGPDVAGWAPGDRAVGGPTPGCGRCSYCRDGRTNLCAEREGGIGIGPAGYARYTTIDAERLFRIPPDLALRTAALVEPVAVALRGVHRGATRPGERVLVTGAGPIGLLTIAILRAEGVTDITVSEPGERRRKLAARVGARTVVTPDQLPAPAMPTEIAAEPYQLAIECSGRADAMEAALANLDRAGRLVLSGTGMRRPRFDSNRIILQELTVTGTVEYVPADYHNAIALLANGRLAVDELIEPADVPLDRLQEAMEQLMAGELAGKVLVAPGA
ncbi:MAG TPA: alcohol dehydrogenase catalytic domain-containing protein [Acidimicrobiales bacterium]|nr:alcohol dehydrogenase catalytic domain-containing protein [Acidimicrobiales bacterium]